MAEPRVLAISGSARSGSLNRRLLALAVAGAEAAGASCTGVDLRELALPIYDRDLEQERGVPASAGRLRDLFASHGGLLLASPEYNGGLPPLLKNALDWASRSPAGRPDLSPFRGVVAGILSASPNSFGGVRALAQARALLAELGCVVLPAQVALARAQAAFGEDGRLLDAERQRQVEALGAEVACWTGRAPPR